MMFTQNWQQNLAENFAFFVMQEKITAENLAEVLEVTLPIAQEYLNGKRQLGLAELAELNACYDLNINWLLTDEGYMFMSSYDEEID